MEDYKEKYEQALENIKKIKAANKDNKELVDFIEYKYPELKESEDEKIRKGLINTFSVYYKDEPDGEWDGKPVKDIIAWLEKQGEQKPADKVEPKFKVKYGSGEYNVLEVRDIAGVTFYGIEDEPYHIDYILPENCEIVSDYGYGVKEKGSPYPTKSAIFSKQNPAWSEEDENGLGDALWAIQQARTIAKDDNDMGNLWYAENWLKSIKERHTWKL